MTDTLRGAVPLPTGTVTYASTADEQWRTRGSGRISPIQLAPEPQPAAKPAKPTAKPCPTAGSRQMIAPAPSRQVNPGFRHQAFAEAVLAVLANRQLSDREASRQIGIANSTFNHTMRQADNGHRANLDTAAHIAVWAGLSLDDYVIGRASR